MKNINIIMISLILILFSGCTSPNASIGVANVDLDGITINSSDENYIISNDFLYEIRIGNVDTAFIVHKFGRNQEVGSTIEPISIDGYYQTPTVAKYLTVVSDEADDTYGGAGAWNIEIQCLNSTFDQVSYIINMSGTSNGGVSGECIRLFRAFVVETGTYSTTTTSGQKGIITIKDNATGDIWTNLDLADTLFGTGQSQIGQYTIPRGYTAYLLTKTMTVDSNKVANIYFFQRKNADDITSPYSSMRLVEQHDGVIGALTVNPKSGITKFEEMTDVGMMGKTSTGTASISVDFELVVLKNQ